MYKIKKQIQIQTWLQTTRYILARYIWHFTDSTSGFIWSTKHLLVLFSFSLNKAKNNFGTRSTILVFGSLMKRKSGKAGEKQTSFPPASGTNALPACPRLPSPHTSHSSLLLLLQDTKFFWRTNISRGCICIPSNRTVLRFPSCQLLLAMPTESHFAATISAPLMRKANATMRVLTIFGISSTPGLAAQPLSSSNTAINFLYVIQETATFKPHKFSMFSPGKEFSLLPLISPTPGT